MTQFIAEIGVNHVTARDPSRYAITLANEIRQLMPDCWFKLQQFTADELCTPSAKFAGDTRKMVDVLRACEPDKEDTERLMDTMLNQGIPVGCSVFNADDVAWLLDTGLSFPFVKVASPDFNDESMLEQYIEYLAFNHEVKVLISTGGCSESELYELVRTVRRMLEVHEAGDLHDHVVLMHCEAAYPPKAQAFHRLLRLSKLTAMTGFRLGLSSHWTYSPQSKAMCMNILSAFDFDTVEMHVRHYNDQECVDYAVSLGPVQFSNMAAYLTTNPDVEDKQNVKHTRKYWVADKRIVRGQPLWPHHMKLMRTGEPGHGANENLAGMFAADNYEEGDTIKAVATIPGNPE